jgi:hypothetical protein
VRRARARGPHQSELQTDAATRLSLISDVIDRARAETPEEAAAAVALWTTSESRAARAAQRTKLGLAG